MFPLYMIARHLGLAEEPTFLTTSLGRIAAKSFNLINNRRIKLTRSDPQRLRDDASCVRC